MSYRIQYRLLYYKDMPWVTLDGWWESLDNAHAAMVRHRETAEFNQPGEVEWRVVEEVEVAGL